MNNMTDEELTELIKEACNMVDGEMERKMQKRRDCPSPSLLYRHRTEDVPLGQYELHVGACEYCQQTLNIIDKETNKVR